MKDIKQQIEEAALLYADKHTNGSDSMARFFRGASSAAYREGANLAISLLLPILEDANRWRKVSEELPKIENVLIKVLLHHLNGNESIRYTTGLIYAPNNYLLDDAVIREISNRTEIVGWRPIESDKAKELNNP